MQLLPGRCLGSWLISRPASLSKSRTHLGASTLFKGRYILLGGKDLATDIKLLTLVIVSTNACE